MHQTEDMGGLRQGKACSGAWDSSVEQYIQGIARKVHLQCGKAVSVDDLIALGYIGFLQATESQSTGKFSEWRRWAYRRTYGAMVDGLRRWSEHGHCVSLQRRDERKGKTPNGWTLRLQSQPPESDGEEGDREARFGSSQELSPEEDTVQKRREARLHHAYRLLSQEDRVLLELYYHFEHSMSEIGEILGCSKGWVSRRHSAILDRLRTGMEPESGRSNAPGRQSFSSCPFSGSDGVSESEASSAHVPNRGKSARRCSGVRGISTVGSPLALV